MMGLWTCVGLGACMGYGNDLGEQADVIEVLDANHVLTLDRGRRRANERDMATLPTVTELRLSGGAGSFRMERSLGVRILAPPSCRLIVADRGDLALHQFDALTLEYLQSTYLGGRDSSIVHRMGGFDVGPGGDVVLADAARQSVVLLSPEHEVVGVIPTAAVSPFAMALRPWIEVGADDQLYEELTMRPTVDPAELPPGPFRVSSADGVLRGYFGRWQAANQSLFTGALTLGEFHVLGNALWHLRSADGRLFVYDLEADSLPTLSRAIELPLFYEMEPPQARPARAADRLGAGQLVGGSVEVNSHVGSFAIDPFGQVLIEQMLEDGRRVLTVFDPATGIFSWFRIPTAIVDVVSLDATESTIFAVVRFYEESRTRVVAVPHPSRSTAGRQGTHCLYG